MDCERFDQHVIGELYDELDELTHAALERHVAGCSRCAGALSGLRATRSVAILPLVEPPDDLEARILAAVFDTGPATAQAAPAAPPNAQQGGVLRVLRWAARPPFAMAAAFLLLLGASFVLLQGNAQRAEPGATMAEAPRPAAAPAATALAAATAAPPADEGAKEAKVAGAEPPPPPAAAPSAPAEDGGALQQQVVAAARSRAAAPAAKPAAADATSGLLAAEADKPAAAGAGAPAGAKATKRPADMGGVNPRAAAAPRPAPAKNVGFAP